MSKFKQFVEGDNSIPKCDCNLFINPTTDVKDVEFWKKRLGSNFALYYTEIWEYTTTTFNMDKVYYLYTRS